MGFRDEDRRAVGQYFESRWTEYDKVVSNDYLGHAGLFAAAHETLRARMRRPYAMLDLGCGDARFVRTLVKDSPITRYMGVDLSETALRLARVNLEGICPEIGLVAGDAFAPSTDRFDVILASYSLHHRPREGKRETLSQLRRRLSDQGCFLLIDLVTREGVSMEDARQAMSGYVARDWSSLTADERATTRRHIESADFIESPEWLVEAAREAGFGDCRVLALDPRGFTGAFCFAP